jgi:lysyl-tRNA synthetase class II
VRVIEDRETKAEKLRANGVNLYPAGYPVSITAGEIVQRFGELDEEALEQSTERHCVAGRIVSKRDFGKASFIHIKDRSGRIQAYVRKNKIKQEQFDTFKLMDIGDFVGIKGPYSGPNRRIDPFGGRSFPAQQIHEAPSREMAWPDRCGDTVSAAVCGPDHE